LIKQLNNDLKGYPQSVREKAALILIAHSIPTQEAMWFPTAKAAVKTFIEDIVKAEESGSEIDMITAKPP